MRIAILQSSMIRIGGAQYFIQEVANRMAGKGHHVAIIAARFNRDVFDLESSVSSISISDVQGHDPRFWAMIPLLVRRIRVLLKESDYDCVIANHFPTNVAISESGSPGVWMCHEPYPYFYNRSRVTESMRIRLSAKALALVYSSYDRKAASRIPIVATNSVYSRSEIRRVFGRNSTVVYPGIAEDLIADKTCSREKGVILSGAPSTPLKGFEYTLRAFLRMNAMNLATELRIVGPIHPVYRSMINSIRAKKPNLRIVCTGVISRENLLAEYKKASLFSYPSLNEPFGIMPVEAVALGTPVLYFRSGGLLETMIEEKTGLGAIPSSQTDFERCMKRMLCDDFSVDAHSPDIQAHLSRFRWDRTASCLLELCRDAMNQR